VKASGWIDSITRGRGDAVLVEGAHRRARGGGVDENPLEGRLALLKVRGGGEAERRGSPGGDYGAAHADRGGARRRAGPTHPTARGRALFQASCALELDGIRAGIDALREARVSAISSSCSRRASQEAGRRRTQGAGVEKRLAAG